jgi:hypothetical protein
VVVGYSLPGHARRRAALVDAGARAAVWFATPRGCAGKLRIEHCVAVDAAFRRDVGLVCNPLADA